MKVQEFLELLSEKDRTKELCIFDLLTGDRVPITTNMINLKVSDSLDINLDYINLN